MLYPNLNFLDRILGHRLLNYGSDSMRDLGKGPDLSYAALGSEVCVRLRCRMSKPMQRNKCKSLGSKLAFPTIFVYMYIAEFTVARV